MTFRMAKWGLMKSPLFPPVDSKARQQGAAGA
jgi:hypothetical protein